MSMIRTSLVEIGPCQPGLNISNNVFQEDESRKNLHRKKF